MSFLWVSFSAADASRLSRAITKVSRPLQKAVAVVACSVATCLVSIDAEAENLWLDSEYGPRIKELALGSGSSPEHGFISGKAALMGNNNTPWDAEDNMPMMGYLHGVVTLDGDEARLQQFNTYFIYFNNYGLLRNGTYSEDNLLPAASMLGLDHFDFRAFELEDNTEGFAVSHLHLMGVEFPFFLTKIGVGNLGLIETGSFSQADLEQWAGVETDFSYLLFLTNTLGIDVQPMQNAQRPGPIVLSFDIEQMRTLRGDIDFPDGTDGGFTAIRESVRAGIEFILYAGEYGRSELSLGVEASTYRQRIDATAENGKKFSQHKSGRQVQVKLTKYWD